MATELLLIEDVDSLGRSGDIVSVKPGFARNFLIPQKKALVLDANAKKMQMRLREERMKRAAVDRKESEDKAERMNGMVLSVAVKLDPEGHMYGSVSVLDILKLLSEKGIEMDKHSVRLPHSIKNAGDHTIDFRLKEGVKASIKLKVFGEGAEPSAEEEEVSDSEGNADALEESPKEEESSGE